MTKGEMHPFNVVEDHFTNQVRLSYNNYYQAIPYDIWYAAKGERAMMDRLIQNFVDQYHNHERRKIEAMSTQAMGWQLGPKDSPTQSWANNQIAKQTASQAGSRQTDSINIKKSTNKVVNPLILLLED
jgi:hypothetical protein